MDLSDLDKEQPTRLAMTIFYGIPKFLYDCVRGIMKMPTRKRKELIFMVGLVIIFILGMAFFVIPLFL